MLLEDPWETSFDGDIIMECGNFLQMLAVTGQNKG